MSNPPTSCDVLIPTYNSAAVIDEVLKALLQQSMPPAWRWRIIVSDDGSSDETVELVKKMPLPASWSLIVLENRHKGAAAARNRALAASRAEILLLLGGDIIMQPGALAAHANFHTMQPQEKYAALGHIAWDLRLSPSPIQEWMVHGGPQNNFDALLGQTEADPAHYFYGSHLSLKKSILGAETFSETFSAYGWEDLELGRRLGRRGLIIKPLFSARSLHRHRYSMADIERRQRTAGEGLHLYQQAHPTLSLLPSRSWRTWVKYYLLHMTGIQLALYFVLRYSGKRWSTPRLFFIFTTVEYWRGILKAQQR